MCADCALSEVRLGSKERGMVQHNPGRVNEITAS